MARGIKTYRLRRTVNNHEDIEVTVFKKESFERRPKFFVQIWGGSDEQLSPTSARSLSSMLAKAAMFLEIKTSAPACTCEGLSPVDKKYPNVTRHHLVGCPRRNWLLDRELALPKPVPR
jgi:hypothetical protein